VLVADAGLVAASLGDFVRVLGEAGLEPEALILAGDPAGPPLEAADHPLPVLVSGLSVAAATERAERYLADGAAVITQFTTELRLAAAEAALADPDPAAPAGLVSARLQRGVAVAADGVLRSLHPRVAGTALAARFAAMHQRLLGAAQAGRDVAHSRQRDGLWLLERRVRSGASVWIFDDRPLAEIDAAGAEALTVTLRALLRRPASSSGGRELRQRPARPAADRRLADPDTLQATLMAVARANGRVAPAARSLGVHRNTVLYRLRRAAAELGLDPRRPEDALRILSEQEARPKVATD